MATIAMLVGGALVNALAFSGSQYLFTMLRNSDVTEERKRHDKAIEQLQAAQTKWSQTRLKRLDWINEELRKQGHAVHTFNDVDAAIREYAQVFPGKTIHSDPEPTLSDFYTPSPAQKDREIAFVMLGMGTTALVSYALMRAN